METGFLNFHDEEHFSISICEQSSGFENDTLFDAIDDPFSSPWDQKYNVNVSQIKVEPNCNEDYQKTLNAWDQHLKELDNSIKCEGGIFLPGIDDPVCFSTGSPVHEQESITESSVFIKNGGKDIILPHGAEEDEEEDASCSVFQVKMELEQQKPVLEAGDLKTLLEQFEAASKPVTPKKTKKLKCSNLKTSPTIVNKSIKDALPKEVIERLRESCKRRKEASSSPDAEEAATHTSSTDEKPCLVISAHISNPPPLERIEDSECGKLLRLEHNYCFREGDNDTQGSYSIKEEPRQRCLKADYNASRKDSGLESGELTDSSSVGSPSQLCLTGAQVSVKQEVDMEGADDNGSKKKKKLKLEEYWERRKKMKALSSESQVSSETVPCKTETKLSDGIHIAPSNDDCPTSLTVHESNCTGMPRPPLTDDIPRIDRTHLDTLGSPRTPDLPTVSEESKITDKSASFGGLKTPDLNDSIMECPKTPDFICSEDEMKAEKAIPKPTMVSVEVQTAEMESKKEENPVDEELKKKKEMWLETMRSTYRPRYSSSSSSSTYDTKSYSRRRAKTSRRYRRRCGSSYSRSRSRSRSRSSSSSSDSEYSSGKSRSKSRRRRRSFSRNRSRKYSSSGRSRRVREDWSPLEKQRQVEERRVIYVGQIEDGISKQRLRDRFHKFGHIVDISLHFRERGDNYGFVTFKYPEDAYQAVEHGNDYGLEPKYDICFGGRRAFCKQRYSDLDSVGSTQHYTPLQPPSVRSTNCNSFDMLLREAQEYLRKRSTV